MNIISANQISFKYPDSKEYTLKNISFTLNTSESLGILGPNGGGKSTLMKILSGFYSPTEGTISLFGNQINESNFPYLKVSYVPQSASINSILPLKAFEYLTYAAQSIGIKHYQNKIQEVAEKVGIEKKLDFYFRDMSGGEKQRVLLAKALLNDPQILLLDEPTKGLDGQGQDQLLGILKNIKNDFNTAVVIVDHNINQIIRHCDKVLCLNGNSHWHDHKDLLTKNVLENIYHCEFEHLLIHENETLNHSENSHDHHFCDHDHHDSPTTGPHQFIRRK